MPAMLDDPSSPTIYRTSGPAPYPSPHDSQPLLPVDVYPRLVTLRDRITVATIVPFSSQHQVPASLLHYLSDQLNKEIENGDTYPMITGMDPSSFATYWFQNFAGIMLLGNIQSQNELSQDAAKDWSTECLGSFYIKPNYPGRSSHVCNAGFLVTDASRNRGVGRLMGESYLEWAPRLGYTYSVFNLVYETNVASCRIWDALGFKRIGRVKGAGNLKSYPGQLIDAIIYGRDLGPEGEDFVSEERFDKIKFYLKFGKYPAGADRAEKSRLRSAATHYKLLVEEDKLMLKDKEVISDPQKQYEIARSVHVEQHGGINKTTATIAERYHWVRIKETVSQVIRNCGQCKEMGKAPVVRAGNDGVIRPPPRGNQIQNQQVSASSSSSSAPGSSSQAQSNVLNLAPDPRHHTQDFANTGGQVPGQGSVSPQVLNRTLPQVESSTSPRSHAPIARMNTHSHAHTLPSQYLPLDPQIMDLTGYSSDHHENDHHGSHGNSQSEDGDQDEVMDNDSFQAMLQSAGAGEGGGGMEVGERGGEDLDMLMDGDEDGEGEDEDTRDRGGGSGDEEAMVQLQAEAAARAAEEALGRVGREYGGRGGRGG